MKRSEADMEIGSRAMEEFCRISPNILEGCRKFGICHRSLYSWTNGLMPNAISLARLHAAGADVIYILTGRRSA